MAIKARRLYAKFIGEAERINTAGEISINIRQYDFYIQKAINLLVFEIARHTNYSKDARMYLRKLEVPNKELKLEKEYTDYSTLAKYPSDISRVIRYRVLAKKKGIDCEECKDCSDEIIIVPVQRDEVQRLRKDHTMKPNYNYRSSFFIEVGEGYELVTNDELEIIKVYMDYYKKHPKIQTPTVAPNEFYEDENGEKVEQDVDLLLDDLNLEDIAVQLAVLYYSSDTLDNPSVRLKTQEILSSLNLVKSKLS